MADLNYQTQSLALTTARTNKKISIGASFLYFSKVDSSITFRINSPTASPITISSRGKVIGCRGKTIDEIYVTNDQAAGTVEWLESNDLQVDFNGESVQSNPARTLAHVIPLLSTATNQLRSRDLVQLLTDAFQSSVVYGSIGNWENGFMHEGDLYGFRMTCPQTTDWSYMWAGLAEPTTATAALVAPLWSILSNDALAKNLPDFYFEVETEIYYDLQGTAGGFRFGFGHQAATGVDAFVGFCAGAGGANWHKSAGLNCAQDQLATGIKGDDGSTQRVEYAGVALGDYRQTYHKYTVRVGASGGTPYVSFFIDGALVDKFSGNLSNLLLHQNNILTMPVLAISKQNNTDTYDLKWGYASGFIVRHWYG